MTFVSNSSSSTSLYAGSSAPQNYPPTDYAARHGVVCEGSFEINPQLVNRIKSSTQITAIDNGILICGTMKCKITLALAEDLESYLPKLQNNQQCQVFKTKAESDQTNLELAIGSAKKSSPNSSIIIYGALTRRIDHVIHSLFLLLRDPGKVFLESRDESIFGYNSKMGNILVDTSIFKTICFFPINGAAKSLTITEESSNNSQSLETLVDRVEVFRPQENSGKVMIGLGDGEVVVYLHKEKLWPTHAVADEVHQGLIRIDSFQNKRLLKVIEYLFYLKANPQIKLISETTETISIVSPQNQLYPDSLTTSRVVSLIPFGGNVTGIKTVGLKWEYGKDNSRDSLDLHFHGISNVVYKNNPSIKVSQGTLLFIATEETQPLPKKTGSPTSSPLSSSFVPNFNLDFKEIEKKEGERRNSRTGFSQSTSSTASSPFLSSRTLSSRPNESQKSDVSMIDTTPNSSQSSQQSSPLGSQDSMASQGSNEI